MDTKATLEERRLAEAVLSPYATFHKTMEDWNKAAHDFIDYSTEDLDIAIEERLYEIGLMVDWCSFEKATPADCTHLHNLVRQAEEEYADFLRRQEEGEEELQDLDYPHYLEMLERSRVETIRRRKKNDHQSHP